MTNSSVPLWSKSKRRSHPPKSQRITSTANYKFVPTRKSFYPERSTCHFCDGFRWACPACPSGTTTVSYKSQSTPIKLSSGLVPVEATTNVNRASESRCFRRGRPGGGPCLVWEVLFVAAQLSSRWGKPNGNVIDATCDS